MNDSRKQNSRTQKWLDRVSSSDHMLWVLALFSFFETIILPIPIELLLIPMMVANQHRIWLLATVTTAGCLAASLLGYGVGMVLYQSVGEWFIASTGMESEYGAFQNFFDQYGFIAILVIGIVPIPFQIAMITAGVSGYPIYLFVLAALIARGIRYFGLAWLVKKFGEKSHELWQRHAVLVSVSVGAIVLAVSLGLQAIAGMVLPSG